MSFSELAKDLERSFVTTESLLQQLLAELEKRRAAWVSVRPDVLAPSDNIEQLSKTLATEEDRRTSLLRDLRAALPTPTGTGTRQLHVNVTRIAAALPGEQARSLRAAADAVQPLAKRVRAEVTLGQRLLRFAKNAQDGLTADLQGIAPSTAGARGYDNRARNVAGDRAAGQLVDGRI